MTARAGRSKYEQPIKVTLRGHIYWLSPPAQWPLTLVEAMSRGDMRQTLQLLLGPDQYATFDATNPTLGDVMYLFHEIGHVANAWQAEQAAALAVSTPAHREQDHGRLGDAMAKVSIVSVTIAVASGALWCVARVVEALTS